MSGTAGHAEALAEFAEQPECTAIFPDIALVAILFGRCLLAAQRWAR